MPLLQNQIYRILSHAVLCSCLFLGTALASNASAPFITEAPYELDQQLNERIIKVPVDTAASIGLEVTIFKPSGPGPFPLVVINHGKELGNEHNQQRYRSVYIARYFVSRGYEVVLPMLRGFAASDGEYTYMGCNAEGEGLKQAYDIRAVINYMAKQPDIDANRMIISGQSYGGWVTLALGTLDIPGVRGLLNFSGGRNDPKCPDFGSDLAIGTAHYGQHTHIPSLWFYGDNDSKFSVNIWRGMYQQYTANGGPAEIVDYGIFLKDAHNFLGSAEALPKWAPKVDAFLGRIGLPNQNLHPELLPAPYPAPTHFAALDDVDAVPYLGSHSRKKYQDFLTQDIPRAFVIAQDGSSVEYHGGADPLGQALELCKKRGWVCYPYAIDNDVVWMPPQ